MIVKIRIFIKKNEKKGEHGSDLLIIMQSGKW